MASTSVSMAGQCGGASREPRGFKLFRALIDELLRKWIGFPRRGRLSRRRSWVACHIKRSARSTRGYDYTMTEPISTRNLDRYGSAELPWSRPRDILASDTPEADLTFFVATVRPNGRPHSAGVGAVWVDGALYFTSGPGTLKSRNLAVNPACSVSVRLRGIDLVLEGEAHRVTDASTLERVAAVYRTSGWPASVEGDALTAPYSAPSAGPAPWHLYRLTLHTAVGVATAEPHGATRWDFAH